MQKQHLNYDLAKDRAQRANELRVAHEREAAMVAEEKRGKLGSDVEEHECADARASTESDRAATRSRPSSPDTSRPRSSSATTRSRCASCRPVGLVARELASRCTERGASRFAFVDLVCT